MGKVAAASNFGSICVTERSDVSAELASNGRIVMRRIGIVGAAGLIAMLFAGAALAQGRSGGGGGGGAMSAGGGMGASGGSGAMPPTSNFGGASTGLSRANEAAGPHGFEGRSVASHHLRHRGSMSNKGGRLRGLARANKVAGKHGMRGRANAARKQQRH